MSDAIQVQRTFTPTEESVGEARRFVRDALETWGLAHVTDLAVLGVSELVTNVVLHAGTVVEVRLTVHGARIRLEVEDSRTDRPLPLIGDAPPDGAEGGRGLMIAAALAVAWGVTYAGTTKTVWLDLPVGDGASQEHGQDKGSIRDLVSRPLTGNGSAPPGPTLATAGQVPSEEALLGFGPEVMNRLGVDDYLALVVERTRDSVPADAAYLLLVSEFTMDLEVKSVSGLDSSLLGRRVGADDPGVPDPRNPHLPVVVADLDAHPVPLLERSGLASLVAVPVTIEGRLAGVLGVASEHPGGLDDHQSAILQRTADGIAVAVDRARLRATDRERRRWLSFIAEAGELLAGSLDPRMTMALTGQIVVPQLGQWCAIYLEDERRNDVLQHVWHEQETLNEMLRTSLEDPETALSAGDTRLGSMTRLPLVARGRRIGQLLLGRDDSETLEGELLLIAESIARRSALALDNAVAHGELQRVGEALQSSLLPSTLPRVTGMEVGVVYQAAGDACDVGGDFYDFFAVGGGRWCFVVGDVCGKGAAAAAVTGLARHTIRALAMAGFPLGEILQRLNAAILEDGERARYLTLACGLVRLVPGGALLTLVCAGHPPPFVLDRAGEVRLIGRPQTVLGAFEGASYEAEELTLARGDLLVTLTDGVLERRDGRRMLGEDGVAGELRALVGHPAQAVADALRHLVLDFAEASPQDDMAVLAVRLV